MCLQECEKHTFDYLKAELGNAVQGEYQRRTGLNPDGLAVLYDPQKFEVRGKEVVKLNEALSDVPSEIGKPF